MTYNNQDKRADIVTKVNGSDKKYWVERRGQGSRLRHVCSSRNRHGTVSIVSLRSNISLTLSYLNYEFISSLEYNKNK